VNSFDVAFLALMGNEGRYQCLPNDAGNWTSGHVNIGTLVGTCWGISAPILAAHLGRDPTAEEMQNLSQDTAKTIAKTKFWDPYRCDDLPPEVAFQVLDAAYNGGLPAKWLQEAAGVDADGVIGDQTVAAVNAKPADKIVMLFDAARLDWMAGLGAWTSFSKSWAHRIAANLRLAAQ
jgi:lysozyme family protein